MTPLARSHLSASTGAEIRLARSACPESRLLALRAAIADGRYRIDSQAIAARLLAALGPQLQFTARH